MRIYLVILTLVPVHSKWIFQKCGIGLEMNAAQARETKLAQSKLFQNHSIGSVRLMSSGMITQTSCDNHFIYLHLLVHHQC